jgi:DNA processing protein
MEDAPLIDAIRLALVDGVGPITRQALVARFGSPAKVFEAAPSDLRTVDGVGPKLLGNLLKARHDGSAAKELARCREQGVGVLVPDLPGYPRPLTTIPDPPGVLFVRGNLAPADALAIAVVGTRHASSYGVRHAERLAGALARAGYTIVSGLARGIDAAAHRGALNAGGRTLAVLGSGVLNVYPPEHSKLAEEIIARGALLSESPPLAPPMGYAFPQRNRIITGLSLGVLVVEAGEHSGALISARHALEQNREVFAMPGPIDNPESRGCHQLIRDGAKLVQCVEDILEELGPLAEPAQVADNIAVHHPAELQLNELERQVLQAIPAETGSIDNVIVSSGLPAHRVLAIVSVLEMRKLIRRVSGNLVARI